MDAWYDDPRTGLVNVMVLVSSGAACEVSVDDELVTSLSADRKSLTSIISNLQ